MAPTSTRRHPSAAAPAWQARLSLSRGRGRARRQRRAAARGASGAAAHPSRAPRSGARAAHSSPQTRPLAAQAAAAGRRMGPWQRLRVVWRPALARLQSRARGRAAAPEMRAGLRGAPPRTRPTSPSSSRRMQMQGHGRLPLRHRPLLAARTRTAPGTSPLELLVHVAGRACGAILATPARSRSRSRAAPHPACPCQTPMCHPLRQSTRWSSGWAWARVSSGTCGTSCGPTAIQPPTLQRTSLATTR
mmetsp:Transcript_22791/g.61782  ORF Transcript_22791/g.61782 Transcript_22791/m.61782 type:complete len:247 (-) Transcript_22791:1447-2187(-)